MATAVTAGILQPLIDAPRPVEVATIERELAGLWHAAVEASGTEGVVLTRARTLTLVVYAATSERAGGLGDVALQTSLRHPSRSILLVADPAAAGIAAEVTASCRLLRRSRKQVCNEQVIVRASPGEQRRFPSVVRNLVLPDMPVVVYWPSPQPQDPLVEELRDVADRFIIDSATFANADLSSDGTLAAAPLLRAGGEAGPIGDLAWGRVMLWRSLTAQFFGPAQAAALERIRKVRIGHAPGRVHALLYAGWLISRLRWTVRRPLQGSGPWRAELVDRHGEPVAVSFHPETRAPHPPGELLSVMMVGDGEGGATNGGATSTFSMTRNDDAAAIIATAERAGAPTSRMALPLEGHDEASLLAVEMDRRGRDRIFEETVRAASALVGQT